MPDIDDIRSKAARALVRRVSRMLQSAYWCGYAGRLNAEKRWARRARWAQAVAFPIARRLDRDAMSDQMARERRWG